MTATIQLPATQTLQLTADLPVTLIHGITGQQVQEETLPAGTVISSWYSELDFDAGEVHIFLATEDNGKIWRRYQSYKKPQATTVCTKFVQTEDENGNNVIIAQSSRCPRPSAAARKAIR